MNITLLENFMKTFDIEPLDRYFSCTQDLDGECTENCELCDKAKEVNCYIDISDGNLMRLIEILDIKDEITSMVLKQCLTNKNIIHDKVQQLFERSWQ